MDEDRASGTQIGLETEPGTDTDGSNTNYVYARANEGLERY